MGAYGILFAMTFQQHPFGDRRRRSATALIKMLISIDSHEVLPEHIRGLIDYLLWKITEADGKSNTRYKTSSALECSDRRLLRHEHVYQKAKMIEALLRANPDAVEGILDDAVGCTVTAHEHALLSRFDGEYGWERYRKAGLQVLDLATMQRKV
jgi:hypothetical protein